MLQQAALATHPTAATAATKASHRSPAQRGWDWWGGQQRGVVVDSEALKTRHSNDYLASG